MAFVAPVATVDPKKLRLEYLESVLRNCDRCNLCQHRNNVVFGVGNPHAIIMIIGTRPGYYDDAEGRPFAGETARNALAAALTAARLKPRRDVYATYLAKCITPRVNEGRAPIPPEAAEACIPFLKEQIAVVQPAILVLQGKEATKLLLGDERSFNDYCGHFRKYGPKTIAFSTHNPAGFFGEREHLVDEYIEHWKAVSRRLAGIGKLYRPDAPIFSEHPNGPLPPLFTGITPTAAAAAAGGPDDPPF